MKALSERFPVVSLASVVRAVGAVHHLEQSRVAKLSALAKFHNSLIGKMADLTHGQADEPS